MFTRFLTWLTVILMDRVRFPAPREIFFAWMRNFYSNSTELAFTIEKKVLLIQRSADDPHYPNEWHMPGGVVMPKRTFAETIESCAARELGVSIKDVVSRAVFLKHWDGVNNPRGHENQFLFRIELTEEEAGLVKNGKFFSLDNLPQPLCKPHIKMVKCLK